MMFKYLKIGMLLNFINCNIINNIESKIVRKTFDQNENINDFVNISKVMSNSYDNSSDIKTTDNLQTENISTENNIVDKIYIGDISNDSISSNEKVIKNGSNEKISNNHNSKDLCHSENPTIDIFDTNYNLFKRSTSSPDDYAYINLIKSLFDEALFVTSDLISDKRNLIRESEPSSLKIFGYTYSFYTFYIFSFISDYINYFDFLYQKFHKSSYPNLLESFLNCNKYLLSYQNPDLFLTKFGKFFDEYLDRFCINKNFINKFKITEDIKKGISWNDLENTLDIIFCNRLENLENEHKSAS